VNLYAAVATSKLTLGPDIIISGDFTGLLPDRPGIGRWHKAK
jgi:hypothetical protein